MKRVGIITIIDHHNFGNRLQNYALQESLGRLGMEAWTIPNTPVEPDLALRLKRSLHQVAQDGPAVIAGKLRRAARPDPAPVAPDRYTRHAPAIRAFSATHVREAGQSVNDVADPDAFASSYDWFVVGSDQVWNPNYRLVSPIDFLTFARPDQRIAYAASFGVEEIPAPYRARYASYLRGIPRISVRERRAAEIVAELTGRDVPVVLDPTLLLSAADWRDAVGESRVPDQGYLLTFFLSEPDPAESAALTRHAAAHGLTVIDPLDASSTPEPLSPLQFIDLISGASLVATDSFHASVFSVLFHRPLLLKGRDAMESRTETLLGSLGLDLAPWAPSARLKALTAPDWPAVEALLAERRAASVAFLEASLR
jgi:hypothetical protein